MSKWIIINLKFSVRCIKCDEWITKDDIAYFKLWIGIKHYPHCPTVIHKSKKRLIDYDDRKDEFYINTERKPPRFF